MLTSSMANFQPSPLTTLILLSMQITADDGPSRRLQRLSNETNHGFGMVTATLVNIGIKSSVPKLKPAYFVGGLFLPR